MHIPDGLLDLPTAAATAAVSLGAVAVALARLRRGLPRKRVPLMGLTAAFLFAGQMINFPVAGGASGHLVGGVLASVLLGPSAALVVLTTVLVVQCLLFADGGLLALGANVLNLAVIAALAGSAIQTALARLLPGPRGLLLSAAFASWCAIVAASMACAAELATSGVAPWGLLFPALTGVHMLIGAGEALITTLVLASILRTRPDLLRSDVHSPAARPLAALGLAAAVGLVLFGAPFASTAPDGLEHVAEHLGFANRATAALASAPMPDYLFPGLDSPVVATCAAGLVGTLLAFGLAYAMSARILPKPAATST